MRISNYYEIDVKNLKCCLQNIKIKIPKKVRRKWKIT